MKQVSTLKELLKETEVTFTYTKKNGETRKAIGTLDLSRAKGYTPEMAPKGKRESYEGMITYWDQEKQGWRSFHESQFVSVDDCLLA